MSANIQRKNHRIHPCDTDAKSKLLEALLTTYADKSILIVASQALPSFEAKEKITAVLDADIKSCADKRYDVLISFDLPEKAIIYMTRLALAREIAVILLGHDDQKYLYGIETLLGCTIIQETIKGFEPSFGIEVEAQSKAEAKARRALRQEEEALKNEKWAKREKDKPKFLGKDADGKPIFDKKTRDRNHYIDGTPRSADEKSSRSQFKSKPVFFGEDKKGPGKPKRDGDKPSFSDKKPFKDKGDKKPFGDKKSFGDKKPYGDKKGSGEKKFDGDKKSYGNKKPYDGKKFSDKPGAKKPDTKPKPKSEPSKPPRVFKVKSLKPKDASEQ